MAMLEVYAKTPGVTWNTFTFLARVWVLMWGLELTLFAVVEFFLTPASTWAAVNDGAAAVALVDVVAASAALIASGETSARAAAITTATRVRVDDMAGGPP